jgi:VanZ family protein
MITWKQYGSFIPALVVAAGILIASLWDMNMSLPVVPVQDKTLHILAYAVLAITLTSACLYNKWRRWGVFVIVWGGCSVYGALIEGMQHFCTATRMAEWMDVLADAGGALIGIIIVLCVNLLWSRNTYMI